jgi:hypothetical protein
MRGGRAFADLIDLADGFHGKNLRFVLSLDSISNPVEKYNSF